MTRNAAPTSARNAPQEDAEFDDLLGRLVDELAMTPVELAPTPVPQSVPTPATSMTGAAVVAEVPPAKGRSAVLITAIVAGTVMVTSIAGMAFLIPATEGISPAKASLAAVESGEAIADLVSIPGPVSAPKIAVRADVPEAEVASKPRPRVRTPRPRPKPKPKPAVDFNDL